MYTRGRADVTVVADEKVKVLQNRRRKRNSENDDYEENQVPT